MIEGAGGVEVPKALFYGFSAILEEVFPDETILPGKKLPEKILPEK